MRTALCLAAAALFIAGCTTSGDSTSDELALLDTKLSQMSPAEACKELYELCATQAKGCIAHDLFCTPQPPPPTTCQKLSDLCAQGSSTACQIVQSKCQPVSDGGPPTVEGGPGYGDKGLPPVCGNKQCEWGESCKTCPLDCGTCPKTDFAIGFPDKSVPKCGNKICEWGESCKLCPLDCGICPKTDLAIGFSDKSVPKCGNKICEWGESCKLCPLDCGTCADMFLSKCGNKICEWGESCKTCPFDCAYCADAWLPYPKADAWH